MNNRDEIKLSSAYRKQRGGRRNGSIVVAYLLGVLLIALAPLLGQYANAHNLFFSRFLDPIIFVFLGVILLLWVYSPDGAWPSGFLGPLRPDPKADPEGYAHFLYSERFAPNRIGLNAFRWPFFRNRNWGLGNDTIVMTVTVVTAAVAIATLLNEFDKLNSKLGESVPRTGQSVPFCQCPLR